MVGSARPRQFLYGLPVVAAALLCTAEPARAQAADPVPVPVSVAVEVSDEDAALTGLVRLALSFEVHEDVGAPLAIVLRLRDADRDVLNLDHRPATPTITWLAGTTVAYEIPAPIPLRLAREARRRLGVFVGFRDPATRAVRPPSNGTPRGGVVRIGTLETPRLADLVDEESIAAALAAARDLAKAGRRADAWSALDVGLRRATEDAVKERFRDALLALGEVPARPLSIVETQIVERRIEAERRRYLRQTSGRFFDREQFHAALRILEEIGGKLAEDADAAVMGALADAKRVEKDRWDVRDRLLAQLTDEEQRKADEAIERLGHKHTLLAKAEAWLAKKEYGAARRVFEELSFAAQEKLRYRAQELRSELDRAWAADTPPNQVEAVRKALAHPAFPRTVAVPTHRFVLIGPEVLVRGVPWASRLRFDLAYLFVTDLFGRLPNPDGDRVTVYFKELWDFGGGVGGGKTIDIGRADPERRGLRIDNGLLYHELTHCVDDTNPILAGFREGLANVGAVFAYEALGQTSDGLHGFLRNLRAFREEYLARDLEYWRIQNYGPSAGFFLHFLDKYAESGERHDWKPYRTFFRAYRDAPVRDGREPYVARAIAYYLVRVFGPGAFDDLVSFRFPLVPSDRAAIDLEMEAFAAGDRSVRAAEDEIDDFENTPLRRDLISRRLIEMSRRGGNEAEVRRRAREELGILHDWRVIGPFSSAGADPGACVFPPQWEIDFAAEYPGRGNICRWRKVGDPGPVQGDALGWVSIRYPYMDNTATYALSHVTVDAAQDAALFVRADDDFTLFVNDELVGTYRGRGRNASTLLPWRGPRERAPDAMRLAAPLRAGRNKLLLRVRNRGGVAGFVLAVARPDGRPIAGLTSDLAPPAEPPPPRPEERFRTVLRHDFKNKSFSSKVDVTVGRFGIVNKLLAGRDTDKRVGWRKYTVRPGFSKDSPSNLLWLQPKATRGLEDFRFTVDLVPPAGAAPKLLVTFQGEGGTDGLSGWNLILSASGKGRVAARLERYDNVIHQRPPLDLPAGELESLVLTYESRRLTVTLGELTIFDRVPIRPVRGAHRVGFATWGPQPRIARFELEAPKH